MINSDEEYRMYQNAERAEKRQKALKPDSDKEKLINVFNEIGIEFEELKDENAISFSKGMKKVTTYYGLYASFVFDDDDSLKNLIVGDIG